MFLNVATSIFPIADISLFSWLVFPLCYNATIRPDQVGVSAYMLTLVSHADRGRRSESGVDTSQVS